MWCGACSEHHSSLGRPGAGPSHPTPQTPTHPSAGFSADTSEDCSTGVLWHKEGGQHASPALHFPLLQGQRVGLGVVLHRSQKATQAGDPGAHRHMGLQVCC